jgi:hypothetical protein
LDPASPPALFSEELEHPPKLDNASAQTREKAESGALDGIA